MYLGRTPAKRAMGATMAASLDREKKVARRNPKAICKRKMSRVVCVDQSCRREEKKKRWGKVKCGRRNVVRVKVCVKVCVKVLRCRKTSGRDKRNNAHLNITYYHRPGLTRRGRSEGKRERHRTWGIFHY